MKAIHPVIAIIFLIISVSVASSEDTFSSTPPSEDQMIPLIKRVLDSEPVRFCFEGYNEPNITKNAMAIFQSFGESAQIELQSIQIMQVGKYKGCWPMRVHVTGTCDLRYRRNFARHSPVFSKWRGKHLRRDIDSIVGVDVSENDFGELQIRLRK